MWKLYEIFKVLKVQKRIVSAETISGNTVVSNFLGTSFVKKMNNLASSKNLFHGTQCVICLFHLVYDLLSSVFATRKGKSHFWWPCQITRGLVGKMSLLNIWWCLVGNKSAFRPAIRLESAFYLRLIKIGRISLVNE